MRSLLLAALSRGALRPILWAAFVAGLLKQLSRRR
jgi:hypothetical protein